MKESFYFPHDNDARNDDRILELRSCYGNEGYALFFYTLETMSQSQDGGINRVAIGGLSLGYNVDKGLLEKFYAKCIELGLFFEKDNKIFSQRMIDHKEYKRGLSEAGKRGAKKRWKNGEANGEAKTPPIAGKGIEGNVVSTIVNSIEGESFDFEKFWNLFGKKIDRKECEEIFQTLSTIDIENISKKLPIYIAETPDPHWRKKPLNWLKGRNWEDEHTPGSCKYFGILDGYDQEITKRVISKISQKSTEEEITLQLNKAIVEIFPKRMSEEQKKTVGEKIEKWRKEEDIPSYRDTPIFIQAKFINEVKNET